MSLPPNTPCITFNPALSLQRQTILLQTLREIRPKSVLDVGCGEGRLLECFCRCDEALPLELVAGMDLSLQVLQNASQAIQGSAEDQQIGGRWAPLDITLLHGRFSELSVEAAVFEAVTSSEVIEHLDAPDVDRFWDVHLGTLKPNLLVVTTPNRDFNLLFETVAAVSGETDHSYVREGLDYRVRHDDHRFEYSRTEFEDVCNFAAKEFDYEVSFTGVGTALNALSRCSEFLGEHPEFQSLGYATQVAIFKNRSPRVISPRSPKWGLSLQVVTHLSYERNIFTSYPPDPDNIAFSLGAMGRQLCPDYSMRHRRIEPSRCAEAFGATHSTEAGVLTCQVALTKLWGMDYSLSKLCRFNEKVFLELGERLDGRVFDREFMGLEVSRSSLSRFRFAKVEGRMHILYEYPSQYPETIKNRDFGRGILASLVG